MVLSFQSLKNFITYKSKETAVRAEANTERSLEKS